MLVIISIVPAKVRFELTLSLTSVSYSKDFSFALGGNGIRGIRLHKLDQVIDQQHSNPGSWTITHDPVIDRRATCASSFLCSEG